MPFNEAAIGSAVGPSIAAVILCFQGCFGRTLVPVGEKGAAETEAEVAVDSLVAINSGAALDLLTMTSEEGTIPS